MGQKVRYKDDVKVGDIVTLVVGKDPNYDYSRVTNCLITQEIYDKCGDDYFRNNGKSFSWDRFEIVGPKEVNINYDIF